MCVHCIYKIVQATHMHDAIYQSSIGNNKVSKFDIILALCTYFMKTIVCQKLSIIVCQKLSIIVCQKLSIIICLILW